MNQKIENLLYISLETPEDLRQKSPQLSAGYNTIEKTWEIIVQYVGSLSDLNTKYPEIVVTELLNKYAIIVTPQKYIEAIANETSIIYIEKPKRYYFQLLNGLNESCISSVKSTLFGDTNLHGNGTIVAIIDTGIDCRSREFRNEDGSSRILNIWDQTKNIEVNNTEINNILNQDNNQEIPGNDYIGHGTNVAAIACGNNGVADNADIIVVKMGLSDVDSFPRTTQLMTAVDYIIRKAIEYNKPVSINISFGNNYGDHTGHSLIETYLNNASQVWKTSICVGSGNEGLGSTHISGILQDNDEKIIEVSVVGYETSINIQIWKEYSDDIDVEIVTPSGLSIGTITKYNKLQQITVEGTILNMFYGMPSPHNTKQEIYIEMIPENLYITAGIWLLRVISRKVITGRYDMWLPSIDALNIGTGFLNADNTLSITIPSTAENVISVGAYDSKTDTIAAFTGRGYISLNGGLNLVKPEILAPGVNIRINEYTSVTGTSFATPFVTGASSLLMEWGITNNKDPYLYGKKFKSYLIKGARQLRTLDRWPNPSAGWGALCVKDSLP